MIMPPPVENERSRLHDLLYQVGLRNEMIENGKLAWFKFNWNGKRYMVSLQPNGRYLAQKMIPPRVKGYIIYLK